jgi:hypothetical protein
MSYINWNDAERGGYIFCLLSKHYGLYFTENGQNYICDTDTSLNVFEGKDGVYRVKDYGGRYPQFNRATGLQGVLKILFGDNLADKINALSACGYTPSTTSANTQFAPLPSAVSDSPSPIKTDKKKEKSPAQDSAPIAYETTEWGSELGQLTAKFFASKLGIDSLSDTADLLSQYGVAPLKKRGNFTFRPHNADNNYGAVFSVSDTQKFRQTNSPQYKWAQNKGATPYLFGYDQLPPSADDLFLVEGEPDTLAIKHHTGAAVASLGSADNFNQLPQDKAQELKRRFKRIFVLWDNDKAGRENARKFADKHGFIFVDAQDVFNEVARVYATAPYIKGSNDICDFIRLIRENETAGDAATHLLNIAINWVARAYAALPAPVPSAVPSAPATNPILPYTAPSAIAPRIKKIHIKADAEDRFSVPIFNALQTTYREYISESLPLWAIVATLQNCQKLAVKAPAGAGKSYAIGELAQAFCGMGDAALSQFVKTVLAGCERIIFAVPVQSIAKQLYAEFSRISGLSCGLVMQGESDNSIAAARASNLIITTYDGIAKLRDLIADSLFVVDETHQLASELYRADAVQNVWDFISQDGETTARKILLLSATHNNLMLNYLGATLLDLIGEIGHNINVSICVLSKQTKRPHQLAYILEKEKEGIAEGKGTVIIKLDNNAELRFFKKHLESLGYTVAHFTSEGGAHKDNIVYQNVTEGNESKGVKIGYFGQKIDFLLTTTLCEAGVSFKDSISAIYILDCKDAAKDVQLANRPRYIFGTDINILVRVIVFFKPADKADTDTTSAQDLFNFFLTNARADCARYNKQLADNPALKIKAKGLKLLQIEGDRIGTDILYNEKSPSPFRPHTVKILDKIRLSAAATATPELLKRRLESMDSRMTAQIIDFRDAANAAETVALRKAAKAINDKDKGEFLALLDGAVANTDSAILTKLVESYAYKIPDKDSRDRVLQSFGIVPINGKAAAKSKEKELSEFRAENLFLLNSECGAKRMAKAAKFYAESQKLPIVAAFDKAQKAKKSQIETDKSRHALGIRKGRKDSGIALGNDTDNGRLANAVCKKINTARYKLNERGGGGFTADKIAQIVNGVFAENNIKPVSTKAALAYIRPFYDTTKNRTTDKNRKTVTTYTLTPAKITPIPPQDAE